MPRTHDRGGRPGAGPINRAQHQLAEWEVLADAINQALGEKRIRRTDESRRAQEDLPPELYESLSYYERWTAGLEALLLEKQVLTPAEIDRKVAELDQRWRSDPSEALA
jgi:hypothetical protein